MIDEIRLRNFKCFRDLSLKTSSLTVLTGANGSGKTSILHSLLLIRQIVRQPERRYVELNGVGALELGGAEDIINRNASEDLAEVELLDAKSKWRRWAFGTTSSNSTNTLNATVVERPNDCLEKLAGPAPQFSYLCAERFGPRDVLGASAIDINELDVGSRGEFVAQVLAAFGRSRVRSGRIAKSSTKSVSADLLHQTESWMTKIVCPTYIEAEWFPNTSVTRLRFKAPGQIAEPTRAPNAGFGISYALPIIVAALRAEVGGILLVENPEAHLHPSGQSSIGGFLAQVAADGVQIIVETHSDHVLNGIRVAVADGSASLSTQKVAIHFFQAGGDGAQNHQSMELRQSGQLSVWPAGFFDQARVDLAALATKRRRAQ